jgi:hypothetical protein
MKTLTTTLVALALLATPALAPTACADIKSMAALEAAVYVMKKFV